MKVIGSGASAPAAASRSGRPAADGFAVEHSEAGAGATATSHASPASALGSLEALLALQEAPTATERRRRAVRRASHILDALDDLRLATLDTAFTGAGSDSAALQGLQGAIAQARADTEDPRLEGLLEEIETRAAVELAKREIRRAA